MMNRRQILQISSYPPPRAGWGMRVQFLKRLLEGSGHRCVVLNVGTSRRIPSDEYEMVLGGWDYFRKVWRYSRAGFVAHVHVNGQSPKGFVLAITAEVVNLLWGKRCFLTFHAGTDQAYFPKEKAPLLVPLFWLLFAIPRQIICNSERVKARICEYGVPAWKITPIPAFSVQYLDFERVPLADAIEAFFHRFPSVLFCYINLRLGFYTDVLVEGFARLSAERPDAGLLVCGISGHREGRVAKDTFDRIARHHLEDRICIVEDLDHDQFLTALSRAAVYVRTPTSDGVCSSLLEALSLGIPVVAAENGSRPPGVITYEPLDPKDLAQKLAQVLNSHESTVSAISRPEVPDTLSVEARLLTGDESGEPLVALDAPGKRTDERANASN